MGLDPASTAATIASLQARADDGMFAVTATPTAYTFFGGNRVRGLMAGIAAAESLRPPPGGTEPRYLVAYQAVYRGRALAQGVVAPQGLLPLAIALVAAAAQDAFDALDLRLQALGVPNPASSA